MGSFIVVGMGYGDESKGGVAHYLFKEDNTAVFCKYNGGFQASHTITFESGKNHKFAQLSVGAAHKQPCYITDNFVVSIHNLPAEINTLASVLRCQPEEIIQRLYIDSACIIATPYHKLFNKIDENIQKNPRGSVGIGASIAKEWDSTDAHMSLRVRDIAEDTQLFSKLAQQCAYLNEITKNLNLDLIPMDLRLQLNHYADIHSIRIIFEDIKAIYKDYPFNIISDVGTFLQSKSTIYEGSQGFLIDKKYGTIPNTTLLDTTCKSLANVQGKRVGAIRAYYARHGQGVFPTEDEILKDHCFDKNQEIGVYNGAPRYGWFDAVLYRYAQRINRVDCTYMTCVDNLTGLKELKVCTAYKYTGDMSLIYATQVSTFNVVRYFEVDGEIHIRDILEYTPHLSEILAYCEPIYITLQGWVEDLRSYWEYDALPITCKTYIECIEDITGVPIEVISVGPCANNKIERY